MLPAPVTACPSCASCRKDGGASPRGAGQVTCESCVREVTSDFAQSMARLNERRGRLRTQLERALKKKLQREKQREWRQGQARRLADIRKRKATIERILEAREREAAGRRQAHARVKTQLFKLNEELCAQQTEKLLRIVPNQLRNHTTWLSAVADQLVHEQQAAMARLLGVLPLSLEGGGVPGRHWRLRVRDLALPLTPAQVDPKITVGGHGARELGSALGYALLLVNLASRILGAPVLHAAAVDGRVLTEGRHLGETTTVMLGFGASKSSVWQPRAFWDPEPLSATHEHPLYIRGHQHAPPSSAASAASAASEAGTPPHAACAGRAGARDAPLSGPLRLPPSPPSMLGGSGSSTPQPPAGPSSVRPPPLTPLAEIDGGLLLLQRSAGALWAHATARRPELGLSAPGATGPGSGKAGQAGSSNASEGGAIKATHKRAAAGGGRAPSVGIADLPPFLRLADLCARCAGLPLGEPEGEAWEEAWEPHGPLGGKAAWWEGSVHGGACGQAGQPSGVGRAGPGVGQAVGHPGGLVGLDFSVVLKPGGAEGEEWEEWEDVEVECPRFPPLPSDDLCSIEHWTRAMILDAK